MVDRREDDSSRPFFGTDRRPKCAVIVTAKVFEVPGSGRKDACHAFWSRIVEAVLFRCRDPLFGVLLVLQPLVASYCSPAEYMERLDSVKEALSKTTLLEELYAG